MLVKTAVDNQLPFSLQDEFGSLIDEFLDVFSKNEWDIGKYDVTSHKIDVYPGSQTLNCQTEGCHFIIRKHSEKDLMPS